MSIFDWIMFVSFLAIIVAASFSNGRFENYLWFKHFLPAMDAATIGNQHNKR